MKKIAIIGAGLWGVTVGQKLSQKADVHMFEKGRGIGGRMSTRYAPPFTFDHGAPYWQVKSKEFKKFLAPLMGSVVSEWKGDVLILDKKLGTQSTSTFSCFVGAPHMNSLCKHLAWGLNIETQCEVKHIYSNHEKKWCLVSSHDKDLGLYDMVISTAPAPQTIRLFEDLIPKNHGVYQTTFESCFVLMVGINQPWNKHWIAANVHHNPIKWIGIDSTKPGRNPDISALVMQCESKWTKANLNRDINDIQEIDKNTYELQGTKMWLNGILPTGEYEPVLLVRYRDGRNDFKIKNCERYYE